LLHRSRYHVYYRADEDAQIIRVDAVWHAARGEAPQLP
jgi:plasmid stabilization system protein ParE